MKIRIGLTIIACLGWGLLGFVTNRASPLISAALAGKQFDNSDVSYGVAQIGLLFDGSGWPLVILLGVFAAIWWKPAARLWKELTTTALFIAAMIVPSAQAYYDKTDYAEPHFILPNESAFWVPDVGANKDSQAKFGSQQYYEDNKIAAKRFVIPHTKLENSGFWSNYYVPSGRLIIVDRSPYNREWTASATRGTSAKDEGFHCQAMEGLNISTAVTVSATVTEENAARFLYHFGVNPPTGDRNQPEVVFQSVYFGRSLAEVMDSNGRGEVLSVLCDELTKHPFNDDNTKAAEVLKVVQDKTRAWFGEYGITLNYLGWAGAFDFDPAVQKAINDRYIAETTAPVMGTLQQTADIRVKEGLGDGLRAHGLPASLVAIPTNLLESFSAIFKTPAIK